MNDYLIGMKISEMLIDTSNKFPNRPALMVNLGNGKLRSLTYSEFVENAKILSSFIQNSGYEPGVHIALLGKNSIEWAIAYFAILMAGCVVVPIDAMLQPQEINHIIHHSDVVAIFISQNIHNSLHADEKTMIDIQYYDLESISTYIDDDSETLPYRITHSDTDTAVIIYTSGTTGSPKGVVLSHKNIISDIYGFLSRFDFIVDEVFLSVLPCHHSFEATAGFLTPIALGCGICYARFLRSKEILEDLEISRASVMIGVPLLFEKFYSGIRRGVRKKNVIVRIIFGSVIKFNQLFNSVTSLNIGSSTMKLFRNKTGFGNMKLMVSGGAAIRTEVVAFFNLFGIPLIQGYGLSETSPVLSANLYNRNKYASIGTAIHGAELKIDAPDGERGELLARGPMVFEQY